MKLVAAARRRGRGGDPRHRHDGGDQLPRRSAAAIGQAGRVHRCAARARRSAVGWSTQSAERVARGGIATRRGLGAMVCFNGTIHAARDVTKVHTSAVETFQSYEHGALGAVDGDQVVIHRRPVLRQAFQVERLEDAREAVPADARQRSGRPAGDDRAQPGWPGDRRLRARQRPDPAERAGAARDLQADSGTDHVTLPGRQGAGRSTAAGAAGAISRMRVASSRAT